MNSSRVRILAVLLLGLVGCAHATRERPRDEVPDGSGPSRSGRPSVSEPAPTRERPDVEDPREPARAGRFDRSEEITPEELATIPEPIPGRSSEPAPERQGEPWGTSPSGGDPESPESPARAWTVQIFASEDRAEALRVERAAEGRLGVRATVDYEAPLYKVRLGSFATEDEAHALRDRAVRNGYPGAFRTRRR